MTEPVRFESSTEKQKLREIRRKERNRILKKVNFVTYTYNEQNFKCNSSYSPYAFSPLEYCLNYSTGHYGRRC